MKRGELAEHAGQLNFTPQDSVRWLSPGQLVRTGIKSLLSAVFADYADKREIQSVFADTLVEVPPDLIGPGQDFWFDYAADTGDGFDATFTVASLLGQPALRVQDTDLELPRGGILVLGGDEVYPTASAREYEDRLLGPFRAAMPSATPSPMMLALPGNHDWYDGLTAFLRIFTHERYIGGWQAAQTRSYFTVKLPYNWWLVGLDSQFDSYFDDPQIKYFEKTLTANLQDGDGVIVCSASPSWLKTAGNPDAFNGLEWFERTFVRNRRIEGTNQQEPTGAEVRLFLTGDHHHYVRHAETIDDEDVPEGAARQMVTCGLGGAYLTGTHHLVNEFHLLPEQSRNWRDGDGVSGFRQEGEMYPSIATSRLWASRIAVPWSKHWCVRRNPGLLSVGASLHLALFGLLLLIFWQGVRASEEGRILDAYLDTSPSELLEFAGKFLAVAVVAALINFAPMLRRQPPIVSVDLTALALAQLVVAVACFVGFALLPLDRFQLLPDWIQLPVGGLAASFVGGLVGVTTFGVFVVFSTNSVVREWAFSGQAIDDGKGFLRIRLAADGTLTVHPLLVDEVHRDFEISSEHVDTPSGRATRIPVPIGDLPTPRLIERPYTIMRTAPKEPM